MKCSFVLESHLFMKKHLLICLIFLVASCTSADMQPSDQVDYKLKLEQLEAENIRKDTLLTESIIYFNEIERNLSSIEFTENEIKKFSQNNEGSNISDKQALFDKIRLINTLRIENARKIKSLQNHLDTINFAQNEFQELIDRLQKKIELKDKTIAELETKLNKVDGQYTSLFVEFQEQKKLLEETDIQNTEIKKTLNSVFYAIGSEDELDENGVIILKKKVFSSNKIMLSEKLNESYFTKVDKNDFNELNLHTKKVNLISNHPASSYVIEREGKNAKLIIKDEGQFWKYTKYLVVVSY